MFNKAKLLLKCCSKNIPLKFHPPQLTWCTLATSKIFSHNGWVTTGKEMVMIGTMQSKTRRTNFTYLYNCEQTLDGS